MYKNKIGRHQINFFVDFRNQYWVKSIQVDGYFIDSWVKSIHPDFACIFK
jgi:hypothetical protein